MKKLNGIEQRMQDFFFVFEDENGEEEIITNAQPEEPPRDSVRKEKKQ